MLARPLLDVPKSQLIATLEKGEDRLRRRSHQPRPRFTRPRLRALMPALAAEGGDARGLARLASRLARANAAVEVLADGAERYLALRTLTNRVRGSMPRAFAALPEEIRLRLLQARHRPVRP